MGANVAKTFDGVTLSPAVLPSFSRLKQDTYATFTRGLFASSRAAGLSGLPVTTPALSGRQLSYSSRIQVIISVGIDVWGRNVLLGADHRRNSTAAARQLFEFGFV